MVTRGSALKINANMYLFHWKCLVRDTVANVVMSS